MAETALLAVYDGRNCVGHLLHRGKSGVEAFDADDNSLGLFPTQAEGRRHRTTHATTGTQTMTTYSNE